VFGTEILIKNRNTKVPYVLLNLSNPIERGISLFKLYPPFNPINTREFDLIYANYIIGDDSVFMELMKIIYPLYEGQTVYVLVGNDECKYVITESLIKFIQQRYGYNSYLINEEADLEYLTEESSFSIQGLYNLDVDKERYSIIITPGEKNVIPRI